MKRLITSPLLLMLVLGGCSADKVTEIVVSVATDLKIPPTPPPGQIRVVRFKVERDLKTDADGNPFGEVVVDTEWDLSPIAGEDQIVLPATVGLLPASDRDLDDPILITVSTDVYWTESSEDLFYRLDRQARLAFIRDRVILLRMNLLSKCVHLECPVGYTCGDDGTCVSIDDLPKQPYDEDAAMGPAPDGGFFREAGRETSSVADAGAEGGVPDGPFVDAGADSGAGDTAPTPDATVDSASDTVGADVTVDTASADTTVDTLSVDATVDITVDASLPVVDSFSADSTVDSFGTDTTVDMLSADTTVDVLGPDTTVDMLSPDSTVDTLGPDVSVDTLAPDTSVDSSVDAPLSDGFIDSVAADTSVDVLNDMQIPANCSGGWCEIPAGSFMMGSATSELCRPPNPMLPGDPDDEILHPVQLTRSFVMSETEVTEDEFEALTGYDPSVDSCKKNQPCPKPVEFINWHEAAAYCNALSPAADQCFDCTGFGTPDVVCLIKAAYVSDYTSCPGYRLPTDAEWEYAARAGTLTALPNGDITSGGFCDTGVDPIVDAAAWFQGNALVKQEVGLKPANGWGLRDMHGNIWEWVYDPYQENLGTALAVDPVGYSATPNVRAQRGGAFDSTARYVRSAHRQGRGDINRSAFYGFRCAQTRP